MKETCFVLAESIKRGKQKPYLKCPYITIIIFCDVRIQHDIFYSIICTLAKTENLTNACYPYPVAFSLNPVPFLVSFSRVKIHLITIREREYKVFSNNFIAKTQKKLREPIVKWKRINLYYIYNKKKNTGKAECSE